MLQRLILVSKSSKLMVMQDPSVTNENRATHQFSGINLLPLPVKVNFRQKLSYFM